VIRVNTAGYEKNNSKCNVVHIAIAGGELNRSASEVLCAQQNHPGWWVMHIESAWPLIVLSMVLKPLIVAAIWSVIDMRQSEKLAEEWAYYRKSVREN
jgi:hypothetical protein